MSEKYKFWLMPSITHAARQRHSRPDSARLPAAIKVLEAMADDIDAATTRAPWMLGTSHAMREQMGIAAPNFGRLTADTELSRVRQLAERNVSLPAGSLILTGGLTQASRLLKDEAVNAEFAGMGMVTFRL